MTPDLVQCDCCDHFSIPAERDWEICPVCFWEQDSFGVSDPDEPSGANHGLTLREGRRNFAELGACSREFQSRIAGVADRGEFAHVARHI